MSNAHLTSESRLQAGSRRTLLVVNNIPTPYRLHLFRSLSQFGAELGVDLVVWYMAATESNRSWSIDVSGETYDTRVFRGLHPRLMNVSAHINPELIVEFARLAPAWALFGGSWVTPTTAMLSALPKRLVPNSRRLLWAEANAEYSEHHDGIANRMRTWLYEHVDGVVIPGQIARKTVTENWGIEPKSVVELPNLVDERKFAAAFDLARARRAQLRGELSIEPGRRVILIAARLFESSKGVLNFLKHSRTATDGKLEVLVAGEGPDRASIERWRDDFGADYVRLLGHVSEDRLIELMAVSDAACLPSFRDPNPLFLIEALWSGLPLIVSDRCGNWPEVLADGENGWIISPTDGTSIERAIRELLCQSDESLRKMGEFSRRRAAEEFSTPHRIRSFYDQLVALAPR